MTGRAQASAAASDTAPPHRNPEVDAYIARAAPFARPILAHLRHVVHGACPDVEEVMKWSMPFFVHHGNLCHMAGFKAHCTFGFWRGNEIPDLPKDVGGEGMGSLGRILSVDDLPPKRRLSSFVKSAMKLNETVKKPPVARAPKAALEMPDDLARALDTDSKAAAHFNAFTPSAQREYIEWVVEAKRAATRASRISTAIEWIAEGRTRHWKYQNC